MGTRSQQGRPPASWRRLAAGLPGVAALLACLFWCEPARAAACTWNSAVAGSWDNTANWTNCGSSHYPNQSGASDSVTFTSSKNGQCNLDVNATVTGVTINGFTGELVSNPSRTLTVNGNYSQNSGRVGNQASDGSFPLAGMVVSGTFALSGTAYFWSPANMSASGAFTMSSGTTFFGNTAVGATATFSSTSAISGGTFSPSKTTTFTGNFTQSGGTFSGGSTTVTMGSEFILNNAGATFTAPTTLEVDGKFNKTAGTFTQGTNTVILGAQAAQTHAIGGQTLYNLTVAGTSGAGPIAYWKFDETADGGAGGAVDSSGLGHHLTYQGTPTHSTTVATVSYTNTRSVSLDKSVPERA